MNAGNANSSKHCRRGKTFHSKRYSKIGRRVSRNNGSFICRYSSTRFRTK